VVVVVIVVIVDDVIDEQTRDRYHEPVNTVNPPVARNPPATTESPSVTITELVVTVIPEAVTTYLKKQSSVNEISIYKSKHN
jgi:hypothetical protein